MQVCMDIQSAVTQRAGVGRYTRHLAEHLPALAPDTDFRFFYFDFKGDGSPSGIAPDRLAPLRWCPGRFAQLAWKTLRFPPFDWFAGPADVFFFPNFTIPPLRRGASVVTIHDLSFIRYPEFAEARNLQYLSATIRDTVRRASVIITDSRFSAGEIRELLQVEADRIAPIHNGIAPHFAPPTPEAVQAMRRKLGIDGPYLLAVGTIEPRKNLAFLVQVFERFSRFDGQLILAGMPGWKYEPILERIRASPRASAIRWIRYVEEADLPALYGGAACLVMTSHYEGFGFPPLEAMACGTPAVTSTGGSLAEVVADAGVVVPRFEVEDWVAALQRVVTDTAWRQHLTERGRAHAARFTWTETARQTLDVLRRAADAGRPPA